MIIIDRLIIAIDRQVKTLYDVFGSTFLQTVGQGPNQTFKLQAANYFPGDRMVLSLSATEEKWRRRLTRDELMVKRKISVDVDAVSAVAFLASLQAVSKGALRLFYKPRLVQCERAKLRFTDSNGGVIEIKRFWLIEVGTCLSMSQHGSAGLYIFGVDNDEVGRSGGGSRGRQVLSTQRIDLLLAAVENGLKLKCATLFQATEVTSEHVCGMNEGMRSQVRSHLSQLHFESAQRDSHFTLPAQGIRCFTDMVQRNVEQLCGRESMTIYVFLTVFGQKIETGFSCQQTEEGGRGRVEDLRFKRRW